jgi:hypothetical protein
VALVTSSGSGKGDAREGLERMVSLARGEKGEQGGQGEQGKRGLSRRVSLAVVVLFVFCAAGIVGNLLFTAGEVGQLRGAVQSECAFAADVSSAPVVTAGVSARPSKLGVSIVADSRAQFRRLGCPGRLAPPQPSFTRWARYYGLPDS